MEEGKIEKYTQIIQDQDDDDEELKANVAKSDEAGKNLKPEDASLWMYGEDKFSISVI